MSETFKNASIVKKANVYFGGKVTSRSVTLEDGSLCTLGYMQAGEYTFGTNAAERMEVIGGTMQVKLAGAKDWNVYGEGDAFEVSANSEFSLVIEGEGADYCCHYLT